MRDILNKRGEMLIETVISIALLAICMVGITQMFMYANRITRQNITEDKAFEQTMLSVDSRAGTSSIGNARNLNLSFSFIAPTGANISAANITTIAARETAEGVVFIPSVH